MRRGGELESASKRGAVFGQFDDGDADATRDSACRAAIASAQDYGLGREVIEIELELGLAVGRVQWRGSSGSRYSHEATRHGRPVRQHDGDAIFGAYAGARQILRDLVQLRMECAIAAGSATGRADGGRVEVAREQAGERRTGGCGHGGPRNAGRRIIEAAIGALKRA